MSVIYQSATGLQVSDFLTKYGEEIKNKEILYVVQTNLAEDNYKTNIRTRLTVDGVNVKIGKSEGFGNSRLKAYTFMGSNYTPKFKQSGIRVLFVKAFPKRQQSMSGKKIIQVVETSLKRVLREMGRLVRGDEVFKIQPEELFSIIQSLEYDNPEEPLRFSERLGIRLLYLTKDTETGKLILQKHPDYESFLQRYYDQEGMVSNIKRKTNITAGFIKPQTRTIGTQKTNSLMAESNTESWDSSVRQMYFDIFEDSQNSKQRKPNTNKPQTTTFSEPMDIRNEVTSSNKRTKDINDIMDMLRRKKEMRLAPPPPPTYMYGSPMIETGNGSPLIVDIKPIEKKAKTK